MNLKENTEVMVESKEWEKERELIATEIISNDDLFSNVGLNKGGLDKDSFYVEILSYIDDVYDNPAGNLEVSIIGAYDSMEDVVDYIASRYPKFPLNKDSIYDLLTMNDIYIYRVNDLERYIIIKL